MQTTVQTINSD